MKSLFFALRCWLLALVAFLAGCKRPPLGPPTGATMPPPEVAILTITPQPVTLTTELPGRTAPFRVAEIRPQVSGLIQKRLFAEGTDVTVGQELYQLDATPFQAALESAQAALRRSEANVPALRLRAERVGKALVDKAVSQQDFDDVVAALQQAEADVAYWKAMVEMAHVNLRYTKIVAPIAGRIGKSSVTDGAIVTAYQPVPLATIQQLDPIYVDVPQSTVELLRLQRRVADGRMSSEGNNSVELLLEDGTKYPLPGTLQFRDVTVDPATATVTVRMLFPNPDNVLLPGMFVRVVIQEAVNKQAILVPQNAVTRNPKGTPMVMLVNAQGKVEIRVIQTERAIGNQWLVTAGLAPGDQVIIEGLQKIFPGTPVRVAPPTPTTK